MKGVDYIMILFSILAIMLIFLIAFGVVIIGAGGAIGAIIFGDIFVCILFIVLLMKFIFKKKK